MPDIERTHLRAAPAASRGDGEAHLVENIHERERPRRVGTRARYVRAARSQRREFVADATAGLECQPRLVDLAQDVIHRVDDRPRHRAVDRGGRRLVLERTSVGSYASRRYGSATQRPQEALVPVLTLV